MMGTESKEELKISQFLSEDRILFFRGKQDKETVLNALIDLLAKDPDIGVRDDIAWGVFHREELLNTAIGNSVAVPHCYLSGLEKTCVAVA